MKKSILSIAMLLACGMLFAQEEKQSAVVSVENDYNPVVVQVSKKSFTPTIESKAEGKPSKLIFSKQTTPFTGFTSERDAKELLPAQEKSLPGYFRAGYGIRNDIDSKLSYNLRFNDKSVLRAMAAFDGFKSDVKGYSHEWNSRMYNTAVLADYTYKFDKLHLSVGGNFNNRAFNYQRAEAVNTPTDRQHHMNYGANIKAVSQFAGPFAFSLWADYRHSLMSYCDGAEKPITEDHINGGLLLSYEIFSKYVRKAGLELDFNGFIYNGMLLNAANGYRNLLSFDINPFVDFNFNGWMLTAGANMNFVTANSSVFAIAPNLKLEKNFTKRVSIYAKIGGGRKENGFATIEGITPYWGYNSLTGKQLKPTYRIVDAAIGTRMSLEPLSLDIFAGYTLTNDDLLQQIEYSEPGNKGLIYTTFAQEQTHDAHAGIRLGFDCGGWMNICADARYDFWSCADKNLLAFKPEITANANIEIRPIKNLLIEAGYNFTRYTKSETQGRLGCKHDLHARIGYKINRMFGVFAQGDNLMNMKYYEYYGYYTRGIRGMLGATINF